MLSDESNKAVRRLALTLWHLRVTPETVRAAKGNVVAVELFGGSCTLTRTCRKSTIKHALSIDAMLASNADIKGDIRDNLHMQVLSDFVTRHMRMGFLPVGHQSPPCNQASNANTVAATRFLDRTADYIQRSTDFLGICLVTSIENPQARLSPLYMTSQAYVDKLKLKQASSECTQIIQWPTSQHVRTLAACCAHKALTWYCMLGSDHPKPTLIAFNTPEAKQAFQDQLNARYPGAVVDADPKLSATSCPHGHGHHKIKQRKGGMSNGMAVGAKLPKPLVKALVSTYSTVAESLRSAVVTELTRLWTMSLAQINVEYEEDLAVVLRSLAGPAIGQGILAPLPKFAEGPIERAAMSKVRARLAQDAILPLSSGELQGVLETLSSSSGNRLERDDRIILRCSDLMHLLRIGQASIEILGNDAVATSYDEVCARWFQHHSFYLGSNSSSVAGSSVADSSVADSSVANSSNNVAGPLCALSVTHDQGSSSTMNLVGRPCGLRHAPIDDVGNSAQFALVVDPSTTQLRIRTSMARQLVMGVLRMSSYANIQFNGCTNASLRTGGKQKDDPIPFMRTGAMVIPSSVPVLPEDARKLIKAFFAR